MRKEVYVVSIHSHVMISWRWLGSWDIHMRSREVFSRAQLHASGHASWRLVAIVTRISGNV
jgi:hypothetical protein